VIPWIRSKRIEVSGAIAIKGVGNDAKLSVYCEAWYVIKDIGRVNKCAAATDGLGEKVSGAGIPCGYGCGGIAEV
jgi:hypothetical protein